MTPAEVLDIVRCGEPAGHAVWRVGDGADYAVTPPGVEPHYFQPESVRLETVGYLARQLAEHAGDDPPPGSALGVLLADVRRHGGSGTA